MLTLATIREDGYPQATTVGYVHEDLILRSRRCRYP